MSTSPALNVTTSKVEITDPTLRFLQEQDEKLVNGVQQAFDKEYPQWEAKYRNAQEFKVEVNNYGSDLDHKRIVVPAVSQLKEERELYLNQYWDFMGTCDKMVMFSQRIQKVMTLLAPQPRSYAECQNLESEQPQLAAQIKSHDQTCMQHIDVLGKSFTKVDSLQKKMVTFLKTETAISLKRFCQIVDNEGQPLSAMQWTKNKVLNPVIPLPQARKEDLSPSEKSSTELTSSILSIPPGLQSGNDKTEGQIPLTKPQEGVKDESATLPMRLELQQSGSRTEDRPASNKADDQVPTVVGVENQENVPTTVETADKSSTKVVEDDKKTPSTIESDAKSQTNPVLTVKSKVSEPVDLTKGTLNEGAQPSTQMVYPKEVVSGGKKQNKKPQDTTTKN